MKRSIILALVAIGTSATIIGGCGSSSSLNATSESMTQDSNTTPNEKADKTASYSYVSNSVIGNPEYSWEITINDITEADSIPAFERKYESTEFEGSKESVNSTVYTPEEGKKIILLDVNIKNKGKREQIFGLLNSDVEFLLNYDNYYEFPVVNGVNFNDKGEVEVYTLKNDTVTETHFGGESIPNFSVDVLGEADYKMLFEVPSDAVDNKEKPLSFKIVEKSTDKNTLLDINLR